MTPNCQYIHVSASANVAWLKNARARRRARRVKVTRLVQTLVRLTPFMYINHHACMCRDVSWFFGLTRGILVAMPTNIESQEYSTLRINTTRASSFLPDRRCGTILNFWQLGVHWLCYLLTTSGGQIPLCLNTIPVLMYTSRQCTWSSQTLQMWF